MKLKIALLSVALLASSTVNARNLAVIIGDSITAGFPKQDLDGNFLGVPNKIPAQCIYQSERDYKLALGDKFTIKGNLNVNSPICRESWVNHIKYVFENFGNDTTVKTYAVPSLSAKQVVYLAVNAGKSPRLNLPTTKIAQYPGNSYMDYPGHKWLYADVNRPEYATGRRVLYISLGTNDMLIRSKGRNDFSNFSEDENASAIAASTGQGGVCAANADEFEMYLQLIALWAKQIGFTDVYWVKVKPGYFNAANTENSAHTDNWNSSAPGTWCERPPAQIEQWVQQVENDISTGRTSPKFIGSMGVINGTVNLTPTAYPAAKPVYFADSIHFNYYGNLVLTNTIFNSLMAKGVTIRFP
jgi:hypothetical protein